MRPIRTPLGPAGRSPLRSRAPIGTLELRPASPHRSRAANLPRAGNSSPPRSRPPIGIRDKRPCRSPTRCAGALKVNHSSTAPRADGVRPPFPTVAVTEVPSANSGHCSAIPDAVAAQWDLRRGTRRARHCSCTILPTPAVRTPPHRTYGPGTASCLGRGPATPRDPQEGRIAHAAGVPDLPPRGVRDLHATLGPP